METDLLQNEDLFYKENEKVELQTKELLQKVNDVMKIQENLIKDTLKTKTDLNAARNANFKVSRNNRNGKSDLLNSNFQKDIETYLNIPDTVNEMGPDATNTFFKSKIKTVLAEKERIQYEMKHSNEELKKLQKENQQLSEEKEKWFLSYNSGKVNMGKLETQIITLSSKLQSKDSENVALKKDLDHTRKELKQSTLNLNNAELKLNRAYEENEKLKKSIKALKEEEKEFKETYKKQINELQTTVKRIEKHKMELLNGFRKQMQLIDVLKKQKIQLEAVQIAELAEAEYLKILDWKLD